MECFVVDYVDGFYFLDDWGNISFIGFVVWKAYGQDLFQIGFLFWVTVIIGIVGFFKLYFEK